jgi:imidazolonepropionase-like amidohydrolase
MLAALVLAALATQSDKPTEVRYTVLMSGNQAGFQTSTRVAENEWRFHYEFNDRGRGPTIDSHVRTDAKGLPVLVENRGSDYFKAPVEETFKIAEGMATWANRMEAGLSSDAAGAFYVSVSGVPQETAMLARALIAAGKPIALLPEGEVSLAGKQALKLESNGESREVELRQIRGLDFAPTYVWLDEHGDFFASIDGAWMAVIRQGWEARVDDLRRAQNSLESGRLAGIAKQETQRRRASPALAIVHALLFDAESATSRPNSTVLVRGNRIEAVGEDGVVSIPADAETIDAKGKALLPGLWDMHVHVTSSDGLLDLACGVTSVRDLANDTQFLLDLRRKWDAGTELGPRVVMAGFIDGRGPYQGPTKVFADDEKEARAAVESYAANGYAQIKVYSSLKPELVPVIAELAHSKGMRLSGHVPAFMTAEQFVRAGADEIQHVNFVFLNFLFDSVPDTRTPARFTAVAEHAAEIDPTSERVKKFIELLVEHHTVIDPTLSIFEGMFTDRPGEMSASYGSIADRMPAQVRRSFLYGGLEVPEGADQRYRDSFRQMLKMTQALFDAGVPIVAGTDSLAGFTLHRELELYVEAGIPAAKVLQLATLGASRVMKRDNDLGSIAPGKLADLILVAGDPAKRISDIRKVELVVKDGVVLSSADLCRAIGVMP